jgi:hypothetical protein
MVRTTTSRWGPVEQWSPALLLVGGGLLVAHATMLGVEAFSSLTTPPDVFGPAGHLVALAGLLGLYPALVDRTPAAARVAGAVATVALGGWATMTVARLLAVVGVVSSLGDVIPGAVVGLAFVSTVLTYVLFGVATLRADFGRRAVLLVLAPGALILVALVGSAIAGMTALAGVFVGSGLALSMLSLGHTLRTRDRPGDRAVPAGDVTAG